MRKHHNQSVRRHSLRRHYSERDKGKQDKKRAILTGILFLAVIAAVAVGAWALEEKLFPALSEKEEERQPSTRQILKLGGKKYITGHGQFETFLFMGTDLSGNPEGEGEDYQGRMADYLALFIINRKEETCSVLQLNRDTITDITLLQADGSGNASADIQLCTAHWYGGNPQMSCENTADAVSRMLGGLKIDGYYELPMDAIADLNDVVGGVTLAIKGDFTAVDPAMKEGKTLTLSGEQAFHYVHDRQNVGDGENLFRLERQKQYLQAYMDKVTAAASEKPEFLLEIFEKFKEVSVTDITDNVVTKIARRAHQYENKGIYEFEGNAKPGQALGDGEDHMEFYPDNDSVIEVMTELYALEEYHTGGEEE